MCSVNAVRNTSVLKDKVLERENNVSHTNMQIDTCLNYYIPYYERTR